MKKCPFCAEEIAENTVKCKFCWEELLDASKWKTQDHLNVTIKNFWQKKQTFKCILRYAISIIFIIAGWITYSNGYDSSEICGILILISWAVGLYVATLLP
jgi:uncharacterized membrane protein YvbJ